MRINKLDNVEVNLEDGHKYALRDIKKGENIIKYGFPIGHATADIAAGEQVGPGNLKSNLSGLGDWRYIGRPAVNIPQNGASFRGFLRKNGEVRPKQATPMMALMERLQL